MSATLRVLLILVSVMTAVFMARKLRKSQMQVFDTIYWYLFLLILIGMSLFPSVVTRVAGVIGVDSPVNLVYLVMIFLLFVQCFLLSTKVSGLEEKVKNLVEELAVRENIKQFGKTEKKEKESGE